MYSDTNLNSPFKIKCFANSELDCGQFQGVKSPEFKFWWRKVGWKFDIEIDCLELKYCKWHRNVWKLKKAQQASF